MDITNFGDFVMQSGDQPMTDSCKVARAFGKRHADVLRAIKKMCESKCKEIAEHYQRNFALIQIDVDLGLGRKRKDPAYQMTHDGFAELAMSFTGEQAQVIRTHPEIAEHHLLNFEQSLIEARTSKGACRIPQFKSAPWRKAGSATGKKRLISRPGNWYARNWYAACYARKSQRRKWIPIFRDPKAEALVTRRAVTESVTAESPSRVVTDKQIIEASADALVSTRQVAKQVATETGSAKVATHRLMSDEPRGYSPRFRSRFQV